ncbi:MAG: phage major capsid protein [Sporichthyaceae bacterium]|nr:phage major capsid protein [Sporichthyaceae bacterium]
MKTKTPVPTNAAELEELLGDRDKIQSMLKDEPETFQEIIGNYAKAVADRDTGIKQQVKEQTQQILAEWLKDNGAEHIKRVNLNPDRAPSNKYAAKYNPKAPGAKADKMFADFAEFFQATWHGAKSADALAKQAELDKIRNSFGSTVPSDGGFLIPEALRAQLLRVSLEKAIVRPRARVIPMDSLTVPFPAIDSTSNASSVHGGIVTYWTEEAAALVQSSAKFRRVVLQAKKLTAYTEVPNELFTDSIISFMAFVDQVFPEAIAFSEDFAFLLGSGVGEPLGALKGGAAASVPKESGQAAATIVWENVVKMYARMLPSSLERAVWIANIDTFPELATMALSVGTGGGPVWLSNGQQGPPMTILGRPVVFTEKVETVGTVGDINFVDLGYYLIGDRQVLSAVTSAEYRFANDQTAVRFIERVDGRPWVESAITPKKGANTLTPTVKLATRA